MNSRANGRPSPTGRNQPERVFLVGVELLARPAAKREGQPRSVDREAGADAPASAGSRKDLSGKVPPSARIARNAASVHLHTHLEERGGFSPEESLAELRELATSAGGSVMAEFLQRRQKPNPATLIGSGKLEELRGAVASSSPDVVIFDHELTPAQQRNLER